MGTTAFSISFVVYSAYGIVADRLSGWGRSHRAALIRNRIFGTIFVGFGTALAFAERR